MCDWHRFEGLHTFSSGAVSGANGKVGRALCKKHEDGKTEVLALAQDMASVSNGSGQPLFMGLCR